MQKHLVERLETDRADRRCPHRPRSSGSGPGEDGRQGTGDRTERGRPSWGTGAWAEAGAACRWSGSAPGGGSGAPPPVGGAGAAAAWARHRELVDTAIATGMGLFATPPMYGDPEPLLAAPLDGK